VVVRPSVCRDQEIDDAMDAKDPSVAWAVAVPFSALLRERGISGSGTDLRNASQALGFEAKLTAAPDRQRLLTPAAPNLSFCAPDRSHSSTHSLYPLPDRPSGAAKPCQPSVTNGYVCLRTTPPPTLRSAYALQLAGKHSTDRNAQVAEHDEDDTTPSSPRAPYPIPASPPPSFHSRASSPTGASRRLLSDDPLANDAERTLADTFDADSDEDEEGESDDRQRLMRGTPEEPADSSESSNGREGIQRRVTQLPVFNTQAPSSGRIYGGGQNDGVWANLSAKPTSGEDVEEKPPVYLTSESSISCNINSILDIRTSCRRCDPALLGNHHPRPWYLWR